MEATKVRTQELPCGMTLVENLSGKTVIADDGYKARTLRSGDIAICRKNVAIRNWDRVIRGVLGALATVCVLSGAGCASVATNAYYTRQSAVQLRATNGGMSAGVDVLSLGAAAEHPVATLSAAVLDAVIIGAVNKAGNNNEWWDGFYGIDMAGDSNSGSDSGAVVIYGNGNIINYMGQMDHVGAGENLFNSSGE